MNGMARVSVIIATLALLAGCNTDPSTAVRQPMTVRPTAAAPLAAPDGAIYHAGTSRPLFEDRRARFVGDTLTVALVERTTGTTNNSDSFSRSGSASVSVGNPTLLGKVLSLPGGRSLNTTFSADSELESDNEDRNSNSNSFTGSITVTVIEVLANGNLMVSGEKQVAVNNNTEFIRLSGVVNPVNITSANVVSSTQIADARIENKSKQSMDTAQIVSMLARFFVALVPF